MRINDFSKHLTAMVFVGLLSFAAATTHAGSVTVYTDRAAWELAVEPLTPFPLHSVDFNGETPRVLSAGANSIDSVPFGFMIIDIVGEAGLNTIEDGTINPSLASVLSPNGSTFYLGQVTTDVEPQFTFMPFAGPPRAVGFGGDWVLDGSGLLLLFRDTTISFDDFLPTGVGFLGIVTDEQITRDNPIVFLSESGERLFGLDNITYKPDFVPLPGALPLLLGALAAVGVTGRSKSRRTQ